MRSGEFNPVRKKAVPHLLQTLKLAITEKGELFTGIKFYKRAEASKLLQQCVF